MQPHVALHGFQGSEFRSLCLHKCSYPLSHLPGQGIPFLQLVASWMVSTFLLPFKYKVLCDTER